MIIMECDDCHAQWECSEKHLAESCPECAGTAVHRKASDDAVRMMRTLLGRKKATAERLKAAFMACHTGGEAFADAVLAKAVETGYIELMDGTVWRSDVDARKSGPDG